MNIPRFAGTLLTLGAMVVALNVGPTAPSQPHPAATPLMEATGEETVQLFSNFGPAQRPDPRAVPANLWPEVTPPKAKVTKSDHTPKKPEPVSGSAQVKAASPKASHKKPMMSASGHIL
jgi:hypothetical protein